MNRLRTTHPRRLAILAVLAAVLVIALAFWMRDVVNEVFVIPISYIFFAAGILVDATPQIFFWLAATALAFWIAYRAVGSGRRPVPVQQGGVVRDLPPSTGRMMYWAVKVNLLRRYRSNYYQGGFHQSLGRLLVEMLAHRYRLTVSEVEQLIRSDAIELPPDVREYAQYIFKRPEISGMGFLRQAWEDMQEFLRVRIGIKDLNSNTPSARASRLVEPVIHYMEDELEVPHEHTRL